MKYLFIFSVALSQFAMAIDNDWYRETPNNYKSLVKESIYDKVCEIRHSVSQRVLHELENKPAIQLEPETAEFMVGSCYTRSSGKTPYLVRAVSAGNPIVAFLLNDNKIMVTSLAMGPMLRVPRHHKDHTPVVKTAVVINLAEMPREVIPTLGIIKK